MFICAWDSHAAYECLAARGDRNRRANVQPHQCAYDTVIHFFSSARHMF